VEARSTPPNRLNSSPGEHYVHDFGQLAIPSMQPLTETRLEYKLFAVPYSKNIEGAKFATNS
jgi:hypothetical protein